MLDEKPIAIDLFCGAGGLTSGLEMAGFDVCLGVEHSLDAYYVYTLNHRRTPVILQDIREINKISPFLKKMRLNRKNIDLVAGGPPCQGFSIANKKTRNNKNNKNKLVNEFVRIVKEIQPNAFLMENVVGLKSVDSGDTFNSLISKFEKLKYEVDDYKFNAVKFGVPQTRERVFIVGTKTGEFKQPNPTHSDNGSKKYITVKEAILGDLPKLNGTIGETIMDYSNDPKTNYQKRIRGTCRILYDHLTTRNNKKVTKRISYIPAGASLCDLINDGSLPKSLRVKVNHKSVYRRLHPKKPAFTVGNFRKAMIIHPSEDRLLTLREAARLQSFPDNYRFTARFPSTGLISHMQQLVGDAVPPLLAKAVGQRIKRLLT